MNPTNPLQPAAKSLEAAAAGASSDVGATDAELEIAHVLFIDIVGYSKRLLNEQTALVKRLNALVRATGQFQKAEAAGKLITIPTGDGMALVFLTAPDAPVRCAIEINQADLQDPKIELRMGIHSGPIDRLSDVNDRANVAGAGINMAQRVMDCGDAGHILLSQRIADDLAQDARWRPQLHPLGEIEVKHGVRLALVNLFGPDFGNPEVPAKLSAAQRAEHHRAAQRKMLWIGGAVLSLILALAGTFLFLRQHPELMAGGNIPPRSVAVLPFEKLNLDEANGFLAGGIQDEIITQLSKIGELKVISRTSMLQYESKPADLSEVAKQLGVAAILEGSVQKAGDQIRVSVQLIKVATKASLWADSYDRKLIDLLQVQSEIAQQIAAQLSATLTAEEIERLDAKATSNTGAYALYLKGTEVLRRPAAAASRMEEGQHYFEQAIALDPNFALARARLAQLHTRIALFYEPSALHKEKGHSEAEEALRLQPNLSEGHIALGLYYGRLARDYDRALNEYELAKRGAPNDVQILYGTAHIQMKKGQFRDALANWERATSLDPMNWNMFDNLGNAYDAVGMVPAAERTKRRAAELATGGPLEKLGLDMSWAWAYYDLTGSYEKLEQCIARNQSIDDSSGFFAMAVYGVAMSQRNFDGARAAIEKSPAAIFESFAGPRATKNFLLGTVALARGEVEKARPLFEAELPFARRELAEAPEDAPRHLQIGIICAYLGQKDEAIAEGERAVDLLPISKDAMDGPGIAAGLVEIYGRVGETDKAIALLKKLMTGPNGPGQYILKEWNWDPLRSDPRFQKLWKGPPPKIIYH